LKDPKFCEKISDYVLFKNLDDKYLTMPELLEENKEKHEGTIFYVSDRSIQGQYINMFKDESLDAVYLEHVIDSSFITQLESKNEGIHFKRIDTALSDAFKNEVSEDDKKTLNEKAEKLQAKVREITGKEKLNVALENLKNADVSSMLTIDEENKRMEDMIMHMGMGNIDASQFKSPGTLILNANNDLVKYVLEHEDGENTDLMLEQLYDLARLGNEPLESEDMAKFIARSNKIMMLLAK